MGLVSGAGPLRASEEGMETAAGSGAVWEVPGALPRGGRHPPAGMVEGRQASEGCTCWRAHHRAPGAPCLEPLAGVAGPGLQEDSGLS